VSNLRRWAERIGLAAFTALVLLVPLVLGLVFYLTVFPEGITLNAGKGIWEGRIWLVKGTAPTGIGLQSTEPAAGTPAGAVCARTILTTFQWSPRPGIRREIGSCRCQPLADATALCLQP